MPKMKIKRIPPKFIIDLALINAINISFETKH